MPLPKRKIIKAVLIETLDRHGPLPVPQVHELLAERFELTEQEKSIKPTSQPRYKVEIRWARQELVEEGILLRSPVQGRGFWQLAGKRNSASVYPDEAIPAGSFSEGATKRVLVNRYERSQSAREACLKHYGYSCMACGFNFEENFGELGKGQIHVHHTIPISSISEKYQVDPINHLIPLCPNCHHMIHRREPPFRLQELKKIIKSSRERQIKS